VSKLVLPIYGNTIEDCRYADLTEDQLCSSENLKDHMVIALDFCHEEIVPQIKEGQWVLIVAMATALRAS
jgi:bisphosphoglycerate-dependent phosphoglycerate mutase